MPEESTLKVFRELGLMLFLIGAGVAGGASFIENFQPIYFIYGVVMTLVPMVIGYFFAKYVLKLSLLNNLGSITGGMTSTPALGTLISVAGYRKCCSCICCNISCSFDISCAIVTISDIAVLK